MTTAPATILAFPADQRGGEIRRVLDQLIHLRGREKADYMRKVVQDLAAELRAIGQQEATIAQELEAFQLAVYQGWHVHNFGKTC